MGSLAILHIFKIDFEASSCVIFFPFLSEKCGAFYIECLPMSKNRGEQLPPLPPGSATPEAITCPYFPNRLILLAGTLGLLHNEDVYSHKMDTKVQIRPLKTLREYKPLPGCQLRISKRWLPTCFTCKLRVLKH